MTSRELMEMLKEELEILEITYAEDYSEGQRGVQAAIDHIRKMVVDPYEDEANPE